MAATLPIRRTESIFDEIDRMQDRIMRRAYDIFCSNGGIFGRDIGDWLQAEQELVWKPAIELEEKDDEFRLACGSGSRSEGHRYRGDSGRHSRES